MGHQVNSCLGIPAGPLLNADWLLYYSQLGFDVLTYKTVRTAARECYALPNLVPVNCDDLAESGKQVDSSDVMNRAWAVSFGMPSVAPEEWRPDVRKAKDGLAAGQLLVVSVVGDAGDGKSSQLLNSLADDYATCAAWAVESGADVIEANFSCPNVCSADGQLYQQPEQAAFVAERIRDAIGSVPLILKIGFLSKDQAAFRLLAAVAPFVNGLCLTNAISATVVKPSGQSFFEGQPRGICGNAIHEASVRQVQMMSDVIRKEGFHLELSAVGGVFDAEDVTRFLKAGATTVGMATSAMLDPKTAIRIREHWD